MVLTTEISIENSQSTVATEVMLAKQLISTIADEESMVEVSKRREVQDYTSDEEEPKEDKVKAKPVKRKLMRRRKSKVAAVEKVVITQNECNRIVGRSSEDSNSTDETSTGEEEEKVIVGDYVVEEILEERMKGGKSEFLIKWKGYSTRCNTWERFKDKKLVSEFRKNKGKKIEKK